FMTGVTPTNLTFTPINATQAMYTPSANTGAMGLIGFNPISFFRGIGNAFARPQVGDSSAGTLVTGPNPFPTTWFPFSNSTPYLTTADLPTMQMQTSFGH